MIHWAHTIDGAYYESAAQCVNLREPALQMMQVIESYPDDAFIEEIIRDLTNHSLDDVASSDKVQAKFKPIFAEHLKILKLVRAKAKYEKGVVQFDLVDDNIEGFNKFIPYYLYPETTYSVALTRGAHRTKISVGSNPWAPRPRTHNIATICEGYGGGGHAVVGAVSLGTGDLDRAREVVKEIVAELSSGME